MTDRGHFQHGLVAHCDTGTHGALLMVDLGRRFDDEEIAEIAASMCEHLGTECLITPTARTEFAVLLPTAGRHEAIGVADTLLGVIHRHVGSRAGGWRSSASIGLACEDDVASLAAETLRTAADRALYDAQSSANDRVAIYDSKRHDDCA
ncbi:MAG: hypothetical protein ACRDKI_05745 [Solirubrobacterales bacterium]